jgi:hypothetical protein
MDAPTRKDVADAYRLGVLYGIIDPRRAVAWADRIVATQDAADPAVIEVAGAWRASAGDLASLLGRVPGDADPGTVFRLVLVLVDEALSADPGRIEAMARAVSLLSTCELPMGHPLASPFIGLDDGLHLAQAGLLGTVEDARRDVLRTVRTHRAPALD